MRHASSSPAATDRRSALLAASQAVALWPETMLQDGSPSQADPDEVIALEGDPADRLFLIVSGTVRLYKVMADGRRAIVRFLYPGEYFGYAADRHHRVSAEAVTAVQLRWWPRATVENRANRSPELQHWLAGLLDGDLRMALDHVLLLGRKTASERVASLVLDLLARSHLAQEFALPMSRLDMADHLGLTLETVSRVFSQLRNAKVIALPRPQHVRVLNVRQLARAAGEDEDIRLELAAAPRALAA
jgi:CRP-like cAMP-binding protein